jgi:uncharacterized repeat protein (TIGR02059 family)
MTFLCHSNAQTDGWYESAQSRIDTLRKGNFTLSIVDSNGTGIQDSVRIIHKKHEFPWGTAIDLKYNVGNSYNSANPVIAASDSEVYRSERWAAYLAYNLPVIKGEDYKLTIKLSENYFSTANSRLFDVYVDGQKVLANVDKFAWAGGKFVAVDTTIDVNAINTYIRVEFSTLKDNASLMGLVLSDSEGNPVLRLNCGGAAMTTESGNFYMSDLNYLDKNSTALGTSNDDWVKSVMLKYCNYGVCGNQFKWSGIEPNQGQLNYAPFENTLGWFQKVGWDMRAHTLLWGGTSSTDYHELPRWVGELSPQAMYDTCKLHVMREVTRYKGIVKEYDVLNEPIHATYLQSRVGDSINWNCFKWAHEADSNARLFVNEYNIVEWQDQTNAFIAFVEKLLQHGAPIHGIGSQCHMGTSIDVPKVKARFDQLAQFGLPIKITEFDMAANTMTQQSQAIETSKMMRLAFSHPAIEGFVFWGLTDPAWVATIGNLINEDRTPKIVADSVYHLIHELWSTRITDMTDATGSYTFNGYYGDYEILVKVDETWKKFEVSCNKADEDEIIVLIKNNGLPASPLLKKVKIIAPTSLELTFDKSMADPSAEARNFKVFDKESNFVKTASLKEGDSATIVLTMNASIAGKSYIPVSYFPGNQTSADGGVLATFGPELDETLTPAYMSATTSTNGKTISTTWNQQLADTSITPSDFIVKVNGINNSIAQASLNTATTLSLTLTNQIIKSTDVVTITYQPGSLQTTDSLWVTAFNLKPVTNRVIVPAFISAGTSTSGATLQLDFDQLMAEPSGLESDFIVTVDGIRNNVSSVQLLSTNKRKVVLTLSSVICTGDAVSISYNSGSLVSSIEVPVQAFSSSVTNNSIAVVPLFVSANTSSDGTTIQINFDQVMADSSGLEPDFVVSVNGEINDVVGIQLESVVRKSVILTLSSAIHSSDDVSVVFNPGSLTSSMGVPASAFSSDVTNNSLLTKLDNNSNTTIEYYPNPFDNQLFLSSGNYELITIKDMLGREVIQIKPDEDGLTEINTSTLEKGMYVLILSDDKSKVTFKVTKH